MEEVSASLRVYFGAWELFALEAGKLLGLEGISKLRPTNFGWKVASLEDFNAALAAWMPVTTQLHVTTVDARKLALIVPQSPLEGVPIIELMQRRPGSLDTLGLDHVAFLHKDVTALKEALAKTSYHWEEQGNAHHSWISLQFGDERTYEAKFFNHTALKVAIEELREADGLFLDKVNSIKQVE